MKIDDYKVTLNLEEGYATIVGIRLGFSVMSTTVAIPYDDETGTHDTDAMYETISDYAAKITWDRS